MPPKIGQDPFINKCPEIAVFFDLAQESVRGILRGFMKYIRLNYPWNVNFISKTASDVDPSSLKNWAGDGILAHVPDEETYRVILSKGCPIVLLSRENDPGIVLGSHRAEEFESKKNHATEKQRKPVFVRCDNDQVGRMAAEYFLERGFEHFAYVSYPKKICWCQERLDAYESFLSREGFQVDHFDSESSDGMDWFLQRDLMAQWLLALPKPVAVFAANDFRGRQVLEVCQLAQIPVPYQVAVLGVDNDQPVCEMSYPSLSSIEIDWESAGYLAAEALHRQMKGEAASWGIYRPLRVVSRSSTEKLHISDTLVVHILELIRLNRGENLRVNVILQSLPVSERRAQERFKEATGHSIMEELKAVRLKNIRQLIEETDLSLGEIARSFGFENVNHLGQLFKKEFGMTMGEYRRKHKTT
ncbi:MAG: DNA-binding transcriptional regulator [Thermoguttaceae bacterium]|nr:DNA-binding transcriptional regulator [Thermoguttaceae bacterium]